MRFARVQHNVQRLTSPFLRCPPVPPRLAAYYPPDEIVTFTDIVAECDGKDCASQIEWSAKNFDDKHCDMQAHIAPGNQNISITWDTTAASKLDGLSDAALFDLNHHGWATALNLERPRE